MVNKIDLSAASPHEAGQFLLAYIPGVISQSSTKCSLQAGGYPSNGLIEQTIRAYQEETSHPYESALKALESGCGNCQEMAYAGALVLRATGYKGEISIGQYGINHQFLFVADLIVDPWAGFYCPESKWKQCLTAYGGSIKEGVMYGRLLSPTHFEMKDEEPEHIETIPILYPPELKLIIVEDFAQEKYDEVSNKPQANHSTDFIKKSP